MPTRQHNCILLFRETNHTQLILITLYISRSSFDPIDLSDIEYFVVEQKLLPDCLELKAIIIFVEFSIYDLHAFLSLSCVVLWVV